MNNNYYTQQPNIPQQQQQYIYNDYPTTSYPYDVYAMPPSTYAAPLPVNKRKNIEDDDTDYIHHEETNHQSQMNKKKKRRESHNLVERRRRDNINDKIKELEELLPEDLKRSEEPSKSQVKSNDGLNKGTVLKLSVQHMKDLQRAQEENLERIRQLEKQLGLRKSEASPPAQSSPSASSNSSAHHADEVPEYSLENFPSSFLGELVYDREE